MLTEMGSWTKRKEKHLPKYAKAPVHADVFIVPSLTVLCLHGSEFCAAIRRECSVSSKLVGDDELDEVFAIIDADRCGPK